MSPQHRWLEFAFALAVLVAISFAHAVVAQDMLPSPAPGAPPGAEPVPLTPVPRIDLAPAPAEPTPAEPTLTEPTPLASPTRIEPPAASPIASPMKIEGPNGSIKFGLLVQPQYEALGSPTFDGVTHNLYVRRVRVLIGGTLFKDFEYFFDVDYPNLFKSQAGTDAMMNPTLLKNSPGLNIQDVMVTYKAIADMLKFDAGYMLPPLGHNAVQSAATLYAWDYFANTFRHGDSFGNTAPSPVGRDLGAEARGLLVDGHVEYRLGLFQGLRNAPAAPKVGGRNFFRVAGRVQINLLDAEPGFFYAGSYLGTKRIVSFGAAYDFQDDYKYWDIDGIVDLPVGPGALTAQVDFAHWNGGTHIPALPQQSAIMGEAGFRIMEFSPIVRFERRWVTNATAAVPNETRYAIGLAFWPYGHNSNLKAFYTRVHPDPSAHDYDQFNLQWQVFFY